MEIFTDIGLGHYLTVAVLLFTIGLYGVLVSRNVIRVLMALELMLSAANINLVAFNNFVQPEVLSGHVFAIFVLTVSAAEAALGLAIVIALYRKRATVDILEYNELKY